MNGNYFEKLELENDVTTFKNEQNAAPGSSSVSDTRTAGRR